MLNRYSSRRQKLSTTQLAKTLLSAQSYDRIAGYFATSIFEISGEPLEHIQGKVRIICNAHLQIDDIKSIKAYDAALRNEWCKESPEQKYITQPDRLKTLYELLDSGKLEVKILPDEVFGLIHGKAGVVNKSDGTKTSFVGSMNESQSGWERNYEIVWEDDSQEAVDWVQEEFDALWNHDLARNLIDFVKNDIKRISERVVLYEIENIKEPEQGIVEAPVYRAGLGLWDHQKYFIDLVYKMNKAGHNARFVLADMVGLGKTIQLGLAAQVLSLHSNDPVLIIAPKTLVWQWQDELINLMGLPSAVWDGNCWVDENENRTGGLSKYEIKKCPRKIGIVSQGIITANSEAAKHLKTLKYNTVIVDECHRARRKNLAADKQDEKPLPNNLYKYLLDLSKQTDNMLLGTATPVQLYPVEAWDLLNVLAEGDESVLGTLSSPWRTEVTAGLDIVTGKRRLGSTETVWDWLRNPLPFKADDPFNFGPLRSHLGIDEQKVTHSKDYNDLPAPAKNIVDSISDKLAENYNPFIRRIVRRTRKYLEDTVNPDTGEPYLRRIDVKLYGEKDSDAIDLPLYLKDAYEAAEEIAKELGKKNSGFLTTMILRRVGSSMYAGLDTAKKMLHKQTGNDTEIIIAETDAPEDDEITEDLNITADAGTALKKFIQLIEEHLDEDPKLNKIKKILLEDKWAERGCVIFSQYYDTTRWIADKLIAEGKINGYGVAVYAGGNKSGIYIDGSFVRRPKEEIKKMVKSGEIKILFGTDAASEGLNLQSLGSLINIDLPWNPTKLEQRKGRIQRIGQRYDDIWLYNMRYAGSVEDKVHKVLAERFKSINAIFGQIPDCLEAVWTLIAQNQEDEAKRRIEEVPPSNPFEAKYENPNMPSSKSWESCAVVLDDFIKVEHYKKPW